jgi:Histidine phosphatase superfamily (branch 1)
VRAEPMKFAEKGVEQAFKDVLIPLENVFKFFETYAKIDQWQSPGTELFLLRHAEATGHEVDAPLTEKGKASLQSSAILENIIRLDPEIIIHTPYLRSKATAEILQERLQAGTGKDIALREMGEV